MGHSQPAASLFYYVTWRDNYHDSGNFLDLNGDSSEPTPAAAAEAASGKASAAEAASSTEARSAGTGSGGGDKHLVHVRRHAVHRAGKEERTEADVAVR